MTRYNKTCQAWSSQVPHAHNNTPELQPDAGLNSNFCRNPDGEHKTIWCYTDEPNQKWEYCDPIVDKPPVPEAGVELISWVDNDKAYRGTQTKSKSGYTC